MLSPGSPPRRLSQSRGRKNLPSRHRPTATLRARSPATPFTGSHSCPHATPGATAPVPPRHARGHAQGHCPCALLPCSGHSLYPRASTKPLQRSRAQPPAASGLVGRSPAREGWRGFREQNALHPQVQVRVLFHCELWQGHLVTGPWVPPLGKESALMRAVWETGRRQEPGRRCRENPARWPRLSPRSLRASRESTRVRRLTTWGEGTTRNLNMQRQANKV